MGENAKPAIERLKEEIAALTQRVRRMEIRLLLARAWVSFLEKAYDALLYHGVNYRTMPEYKNSAALDKAMKLPPEEGKVEIVSWLGKLESALAAYIRRKQLKLHVNENHED